MSGSAQIVDGKPLGWACGEQEGVLNGLAQWMHPLLALPKVAQPFEDLPMIGCNDSGLGVFGAEDGTLQQIQDLIALCVTEFAEILDEECTAPIGKVEPFN